MNPIYLSRIGISNFRTYGEDFSIDLPEGAGLTVLCGMNGLGKTAFFDAIEWAFLGSVQRLSNERMSAPTGDPFTREGVTPGSHRVELSWSGGQKFVRTKHEPPAQDAIIALLKDQNWGPQIHDLAVYLRLTHFLPQATRERFLEQESKKKWSLLQGPAGVERLDRLRKLLDDGKARNAFARHISGLEKSREEAKQRIDRWTKILTEHENWAGVAEASAAISPGELQQLLGELEQALPPSERITLPADSVQRLGTIRTAVEKSSSLLRNRMRNLEMLRKSAQRYAELTQRIRAISEASADDQKELDELRRSQEDAKGKVTSGGAAITELESKKTAAYQLSVAALETMETESRRSAASKQRLVLAETIAGIRVRLAELEQRRIQHRKRTEDYNSAVRGMEMARKNLRSLTDVEQALTIVERAVCDYDAKRKDEGTLIGQKAALFERKIIVEQTVALLNTKMKEVAERLAEEQRSADDAARALAQLVKHLHADETVCPVCTQIYPPGELLRKAQNSIERTSSRTAALIDELRKLQGDAAGSSHDYANLNRELSEVDALLNALSTQSREIERQKNELLQRCEFTGASFEMLPLMLKERSADLSRDEQEFSAKVAELRVSDELALAVQKDDVLENNLRNGLMAATAEFAECDRTILECDVKLSTAAEIISWGGELQNLPNYREERLREVAHLEGDIRVLKVGLEEHIKTLHTANKTFAEKRAKVEAETKLRGELSAELGHLITNWQKLAMQGEPSESAVQEEMLSVEKKVSEQEIIIERIAKTVKGVEAWARRSQLVGLESTVNDLIKEVGAETKQHCTEILQQQLNAKEAAIIHAQAAQKRAEGVAGALSDMAHKFSTSALDPLSASVSDFNRVISPFPYEFRLVPHITATRASTRARVTVPSVRSNDPIERDPEWWLSEGQMSAMGLSVLLAASTVYRWSRWRALLLDDPLQNTDLIHAAAFGDVIRGLMCDEGYQVIVSTHNHDEADFLIRKCRRANLPVRKVELLSLGPEGVCYRTREW